MNQIIVLGLVAGAITSMGFIPQIVKGYRTKRLDDVSYLMLLVLAIGMTLWLIYGILKSDMAIMAANTFGVGCCIFTMIMKRFYFLKTNIS